MIYLNGISCRKVGVVIEHRAARPIPKRRSLHWTVPGRSGELIHYLDSWETVPLSYDIAVLPRSGSLAQTVDAAVAWLCQGGVMRLEDDTDPDVFQLVTYSGGESLSDVLHRARRASVTFEARPERFYKAGESAVDVTDGLTLINPSIYPAKPKLALTGAGGGSVAIGGKVLTVSSCEGLILDCERHSVSGFSGTPPEITGDWPVLPAGETAVTISGGITAAEIIPRWWTL